MEPWVDSRFEAKSLHHDDHNDALRSSHLHGGFIMALHVFPYIEHWGKPPMLRLQWLTVDIVNSFMASSWHYMHSPTSSTEKTLNPIRRFSWRRHGSVFYSLEAFPWLFVVCLVCQRDSVLATALCKPLLAVLGRYHILFGSVPPFARRLLGT
jgi:hypothetical protein